MTQVELFGLYVKHYEPLFLVAAAADSTIYSTIFCTGTSCRECKIKRTCPQSDMGLSEEDMLEVMHLYPEYFI